MLTRDRRGRIWAGGNDSQVAFGRRGGAWTVWDGENGLHPAGRMAILADREGRSGSRPTAGLAAMGRALVFGLAGTADGGFLAAVFNRGVWRWDGREMHQLRKAEGLTEDARLAMERSPGWFGPPPAMGLSNPRTAAGSGRCCGSPTASSTLSTAPPNAVWHATSAALCALFAVTRWRTRRLAARAHRLERAVQEQVAQIKVLGGLLPICAGCKKVRDDARLLAADRELHPGAFGGGVQPWTDCVREIYPDMADEVASGG